MDLGFLAKIEIITKENTFIQALDFWRESFHCHVCRQTRHMKANFPSSFKEMVAMEREEDISLKENTISQFEVVPPSSFNRDSFIGKMHTFFPSFFNTLSKNDIVSLLEHEDWIVDIFGIF